MHRTLSLGWGVVTVASMSGLNLVSSPAPVRAHEPSCGGTLLQFSVVEQGKSAVARFRFSLAVSGEGATEQAALAQLNQRLAGLRDVLQPFIRGRLVVPSPSTYPRPRRNGAQPSFAANAGVSGEVNRQRYNKLIQTLGGQPGVRMQRMESVADEQAETVLLQRLTAAALRRGKAEADSTAAAIGATRVRLLRVNRRDAMHGPRRVQLSETMRAGFDPGEAPEPMATARIELLYCLM